jgi:hypothetical protein
MLLYVSDIRRTRSCPFGNYGTRDRDSKIYSQGVYPGVASDSSSDSRGATQGVGSEGYIRTLPHVLSLVLRLQSYIVTCVYLLITVTLLLDYNPDNTYE